MMTGQHSSSASAMPLITDLWQEHHWCTFSICVYSLFVGFFQCQDTEAEIEEEVDLLMSRYIKT